MSLLTRHDQSSEIPAEDQPQPHDRIPFRQERLRFRVAAVAIVGIGLCANGFAFRKAEAKPNPPVKLVADDKNSDSQNKKANSDQTGASKDEKKRFPVPDSEAQSKSLKDVQSLFKSDFEGAKTAPTKIELAKKLIAKAGESANDSAGCFALCQEAIKLAIAGGDAQIALRAIDDLEATHEVDATRLQVETLTALVKTALTKPQKRALAEESLKRVDALLYSEDDPDPSDYATADQLSEIALKAARSLTDPVFLKQVTARNKSVENLKQLFNDVQTAMVKFETAPDDAAANQTVGIYLCFYRNDWPSGLPRLAKGTDSVMRPLAEKELANPAESSIQVAVADGWWEFAAKHTDTSRGNIQRHAGEWYKRSLPQLTGLSKEKVEKRLKELNTAEIQAAKIAGTNSSPSQPVRSKSKKQTGGSQKSPKTAAASPSPNKKNTAAPSKPAADRVGVGDWADLLDWAAQDPALPAENLEGKASPTGITLLSKHPNRLFLPAIIDGNYEMELEFVRHEGGEAIEVYFPVGMRNVSLWLSAGTGQVGGLSCIDGKNAYENNPTTRRPSPISNNVKHRVVIRVQRSGTDASVNVDLDDARDYISWKGPYSNLIPSGEHDISTTRRPTIGAWDSRVTYQKVRVRMTTGQIQRHSITDADRERDLEEGFVRLVGQAANSPTVGWASLMVNRVPVFRGSATAEFSWPIISRNFRICQDFYGAHAPSRLKCPIPPSAKSFTAVGYCTSIGMVKYLIYIDGKLTYDSGVVSIAAINIDIPPKSKLLELVIDENGYRSWDHTYWCYPRFHKVTSDKVVEKMLDGTPAIPFTVASSVVGHDVLSYNKPIKSLSSVPVHFRDAQPCDEFLFAHAPSSVTYTVPEGMTRLTAIGYCVTTQHVRFEVWADARQVYQSGAAGIAPIDVKLPPGAKTLELRVNDLGDARDDWSMWCYPRLYRK